MDCVEVDRVPVDCVEVDGVSVVCFSEWVAAEERSESQWTVLMLKGLGYCGLC